MNHDTSKALHVSRSAVALVALLALLPWLAVFLLLDRGAPAPTAPAAFRAPAPVRTAATIPGRPGPWGDLAITRVLIEPPESLLPLPSAIAAPHVWTIRGLSSEQLRLWFEGVPLSPELRTAVANPTRWEVRGDTIVIRPGDDVVAALTPEARSRIYTLLSEFPENSAQNAPFRFRADVADEWFRDSDLEPRTIELVKKFLYQRGTSLLFSDTNLVLPRISTQAERMRLIKTLSRKSTLMVQLRLHPDSDVEALAAYWGRGQRSRDIAPLLRSLQPKEGVATIDLIHLLPRMPRQLLYTYPLPNEKGSDSFMDCHWTSLNFFNLHPEPLYEDIAALQQSFAIDYFLLTSKPTFGDILLFTRPDNSVIHSCVYLADDIVYTKNGAQPNAPWILMALSDVIAYYPSEKPIEIQYYRAKRLAQP